MTTHREAGHDRPRRHERRLTRAVAGSAATSPVARFLRATEIDTRMLGMIGALALIWIGFHFYG